MSPPERPLKLDSDGPVFAEPWQAQAFALAVKLQEEGLISATEWATALGAEIKAAQARGDPDDGTTYYSHWLAALERLVTEKGLVDSAALKTRKDDWTEAYLSTPHGQPVHLKGAAKTADG